MPQPLNLPRLRPVPRLDDSCQTVLEKCLLRAFFVLAKSQHNYNRLRTSNCSPLITHLREKCSYASVDHMRSYLYPKLPLSYRHKIVNNIMTSLSEPIFEDRKITNEKDEDFYNIVYEYEWRFKALDEVAEREDMTEVVHIYLKCLLLSYVTNLDFSHIYSLGSCWVAKSRRLLFSWEKISGRLFSELKIDRDDLLDFDHIGAYWRDLLYEHINCVHAGALKAAPYFNQLNCINVDHMASGPLIWAIGCNCPKLEELSLYMDTSDRGRYTSFFEADLVSSLSSLYGHKKLTKTAFRGRPVGCPSLQRIVLPSVAIIRELERVVAKMLCYLPKIKELANIAFPGVFAQLLQNKTYKRRPLALTNLDEGHTSNRMEEICDYFSVDMRYFFPNVTKIKLLHSKFDGCMKTLTNFPRLKHLEVKVNDKESELEFGPYCTNLTHLRSDCRWDEKKLVGLSQRAPNLEVFFSMCGSMYKQKKSRDTMTFPKMRILKLCNLTHFRPEPFISLIKASKNLTHLLIENEENTDKYTVFDGITDKVIASIVSALQNLKVFHLKINVFSDDVRYPITEKGLFTLLQKCPELVEIGNIFHWDIPYKEALGIKKKAKDKNWNVDIYPPDNI